MSNTKTKVKAPAKKNSSNNLDVVMQPGENQAELQARTVTSPAVRAAVTVQAFGKVFGETDLQSLVTELSKQCKRARDGDLARAENLLISQAHSLDGIFNELARRAALNMGEYINATDTYLRLALKAQSQCRATLETLATIKNPPVIYAKQANISNGPQQINNGMATPAPANGENEIEQSKLSGDGNELLTDTRASQAKSRVDSTLEAVGEINRAEIG